MLDLISHYAGWIVGVGAALAVLVAGFRKARAKIGSLVAKINLGVETLTGRDEIRHPDTGQVLMEATPPLGKRFANLEQALVRVADTNEAVVRISRRVDALDTKLEAHIAACPPSPVTVVNNPPS